MSPKEIIATYTPTSLLEHTILRLCLYYFKLHFCDYKWPWILFHVFIAYLDFLFYELYSDLLPRFLLCCHSFVCVDLWKSFIYFGYKLSLVFLPLIAQHGVEGLSATTLLRSATPKEGTSNKESKAGEEGELMKGCITEQSATVCNGLRSLRGLSHKSNRSLSRPSIAEEKGKIFIFQLLPSIIGSRWTHSTLTTLYSQVAHM